MKTLLEQLVRHIRWADLRVADALRSLAPPPQDAVRLFTHIAAAEDLYWARMVGQDPFPQNFWPELSLEAGRRLAEDAGARLTSFVHSATEEELSRPVRYRNSTGRSFDTPPARLLAHLALHGEHHRGQIARIVREAGGEPPVTDLIVFLRESS